MLNSPVQSFYLLTSPHPGYPSKTSSQHFCPVPPLCPRPTCTARRRRPWPGPAYRGRSTLKERWRGTARNRGTAGAGGPSSPGWSFLGGRWKCRWQFRRNFWRAEWTCVFVRLFHCFCFIKKCIKCVKWITFSRGFTF